VARRQLTLDNTVAAELAGSEDLTLNTYDGLFHEVFNEPEQERVLDDLITWLRPRVGGGAVSS